MHTSPTNPVTDNTTTRTAPSGAGDLLDPVSRLSEILFGLIMVLTFTGSFSVTNAGREDVRALLAAAIGCNLAWGLVDSVVFLVQRLCERGRNQRLVRRLHQLAVGDREAGDVLAQALPNAVHAVLTPGEIASLHERLLRYQAPAGPLRPTALEWRGAVAVFLLVSGATLPVIVPFVFLSQPLPALRLSNAIALVMMAIIGTALARYAGSPRPILTGLAFALFGTLLVAVTIALGG